MAEPVSATICGTCIAACEIIGPVVTIAGTTVSLIQSAGIFIYFIVYIIVTIIVKFIYVVVLGFLTPCQGFVGWIFYKTEVVVADLQSDRFDDNPIQRNRINSDISLFGVISLILEEIRLIIQDFILFISPLLSLFPWIVIFGVLLVLGVLITIPFIPLAFQLVDATLKIYVFWINSLAFSLNQITTWIIIWTKFYNSMLTLVVKLGSLLFKVFCPNSPLTGDINIDCPTAALIDNFIQITLPIFTSLFNLALNLFYAFFDAIKGVFCPNGCSISICQTYLNVDVCNFDFQLALTILFSLLLQFITTFLWMGVITTYFILDVCIAFLSIFQFVLSRYFSPSQAAQFAAFVASTGYDNLAGVNAPAALQPLIQFNLFFEHIAKFLFRILAQLLDSGFSMLDLALCNALLQPFQCIGYKICSTFLKGFSLNILPKISIWVDLNRDICENTLNIRPANCKATCDYCPFKPFGLGVIVDWWKYANRLPPINNANAGYMFTPCNLISGCCNWGSSIMQRLFP